MACTGVGLASVLAMDNQSSRPGDAGRYPTEIMKKALVILLVSFLLFSIPIAIHWTREDAPMVGTSAPSEYIPHPHGALASSTLIYPTLISPSGTFRLGVDPANVVRLVIPTDEHFATPDGISTASSFADVQAITKLPAMPDGKFGYTVTLPSGWVARFDARYGTPEPTSQVASVFVR